MTVKTLVLGFGGTGTHILTYLKELAVYKYGSRPSHLAFIEFDTIARNLWRPGETVDVAGGAGAKEMIAVGIGNERISLDPNAEYLSLEEGHPGLRALVENEMSAEGDRNRFPQFKDWLHTDWISKIVPPAARTVVNGAAQQRQIGRYAMFANFDRISAQITKVLQDLTRSGDGDVINVWVIGSAAGGTGAGCIIDAAMIVRHAAKQMDLKPTVAGVIVLPDVYEEAFGISRARAYSFFRELARFQELGIPTGDRFATGSTPATASAETTYDSHGNARAFVPDRLFDYLVYLGERCKGNEKRISFFNSVANAIDSFLDVNIGPKMMEEMVNLDGNPLSFGGARLSIPLNTYSELFVWEQVQAYLRLIGAPKEDERGFVSGVYSGALRDRQAAARLHAESLLNLFKELSDLAEQERDRLPVYVENNLDPETIVTRWYEFGAIEVSRQEVSVDEQGSDLPLAYCNPFLSLNAIKDDLPPERILVKTYDENKRSKGIKESQLESRDRFAQELRSMLDAYTDPKGGAGTFEKGRRLVRRVITRTLTDRVDQRLTEAINAQNAIGQSTEAPAEGTALTRLYAETLELGGIEGPLGAIEDVLKRCLDHLDTQAASQRQEVIDSINQLGEAKAPFMALTTWIEGPQKSVREEAGRYVRWFQKRNLLADMREIVGDVRRRYAIWGDAIHRVLVSAVLPQAGEDPALVKVRRDHVDRLNDRLLRLARDDRALISLAPREDQANGRFDTTMRGFADVMRRQAVIEQGRTLAGQLTVNSRWTAAPGKDGTPVVSLAFVVGGALQTVADPRRLHEQLRDRLQPTVTDRLKGIDVFDYLLYEQNTNHLSAQDIAVRFNESSRLLLSGANRGSCRWVFGQPSGGEKQNIADAITVRLRDICEDDVSNSISNYSDPTSLILLKAAHLTHGSIRDVQDCQREYLDIQRAEKGTGRDPELLRALIYHPFRGEAEAWFIERRYIRRNARVLDATDLIPPRIVRLLDRPDMFRAFVHCLATGAVYHDDGERHWYWSAPNRDTPVDLDDGDLMRAAVVFVLQKREAGRANRFQITAALAQESARLASLDPQRAPLRASDATGYFEQLEAFTDDGYLTRFLETHVPLDEQAINNVASDAEHRNLIEGLRMAMQYFGDPSNKAELSARTLY